MGDSFSWNSHGNTQFYLDDLDDQLTTAALRMVVKDLLILFQAVNEGVINVLGKRYARASRERLSYPTHLEHYFEMTHVDAEQALVVYRHFCKQAEYAVEFLGVAKKLQNILNVPIPSLKHVMSPTSRTRFFTHMFSRRHPSPLWGPWRSI